MTALLCALVGLLAAQVVPAFALTTAHRVTHLESRTAAVERTLKPLPLSVTGLKTTVGQHTQAIESLQAAIEAPKRRRLQSQPTTRASSLSTLEPAFWNRWSRPSAARSMT